VTVSADRKVLGVSLGANATLDITNSAGFEAVERTATGTNLGVIDVESGSRFNFGGVGNDARSLPPGTPAGVQLPDVSKAPFDAVSSISACRPPVPSRELQQLSKR
jgi:hypothetical protein